MTKSTTDPVEVLEKNLEKLQNSLRHHHSFLGGVKDEVAEAKRYYDQTNERYEKRVAEIKDMEQGISRHREAIARLESAAKRDPEVVVNLAQVVTDSIVGNHRNDCQNPHHFGSCQS